MSVLWPNGGLTPPVFYRNASSGFRWTSAFGMRAHPVTGAPETFHYGLDMIGWSIIIAPVTGVVTFAGYNGGAGNEVRIREDGTGDVFRLLHNRELWVKTGQRVGQGQQVAVMGTTGSSTGVHCHEETRPGGGAAIDPLVYYARRNGGSPAGGESDDVNSEQDNAVMSTWKAMFFGGGAAGDQSVIARLVEIQNTLRAISPRVVNLDQQVTGADNFDAKVGPSVAGRLIAVQKDVAKLVNRPAVELTPEQIAELARDLAAEGVGGASEAQVAAIVDAALGRLVLVSEDAPTPA